MTDSLTDAAVIASSEEAIERLCIRNVVASNEERIFFKDREGRLLLVSNALREVVGRQAGPENVIGKSDLDFASEAHAAAARADEARVMATGEPILAKVQRETFDDRPDDWAQTSRLPLRDDTGEIVGTWGITRDITAQVTAEAELRASREQLQAREAMHRVMFEQNPYATCVYDRSTLQIVATNNAAVTTYGYSREEFSAMTITDLIPTAEVDLYGSSIDPWKGPAHRGLRTADPQRHRRKDGTTVEVEVTSNDVVLDGRQCRIKSSHDVTERNRAAGELTRALDAAVEASNLKSAFLANISHEIRTPMNGVLGLTELLLDTSLDEEQQALAVQVTRSGELMVELINDILDISKIEAGEVVLELADYSLRATLEQTCAVAGIQAQTKGLEFVLEIADSVPEQTRGDARRLRQVLLNLVANAVKFTSEGSVSVRASSTTLESTDVLRIEVTDTGIGIDPVGRDRLFEPFTQADVSTTRNYGGTGLGLAIARELTELMGGVIGVDSEIGSGSTFWLELPLSSSSGGAVRPPRPSSGAAPLWVGEPSILVAEDSAVNQIVASRTLERCGCRVTVVPGGRQALDALSEQEFDAVLMDCQMPGMDGYQATIELRRLEDGGRRTPVIAMTAFAMSGAADACLAAGMDDYVSKPIQRDDLIETLRRWLPTHASGGGGDG
jgi:PAS domain S-box-containing protein